MKYELFYDAAPTKSQSIRCQSDLAKEFFPLVRGVVNRMRNRLPANADLQELESVGVQGLMSAVKRYDASKATTFSAYASTRIRGAILDELRKMDTLTRSSRSKIKTINETIGQLEQALGRTPSDQEIAAKMAISLRELDSLRAKVTPQRVISLDDETLQQDTSASSLHEAIADERIVPIYEHMQDAEAANLLGEEVSELPERLRQVVNMYYFENMLLAEIAEVFGVTEARICQIHAQALSALRRKMEQKIAA